MPVESHVESLKARHQELESQLHSMKSNLSVGNEELAQVKRQKLLLKDKINALQA